MGSSQVASVPASGRPALGTEHLATATSVPCAAARPPNRHNPATHALAHTACNQANAPLPMRVPVPALRRASPNQPATGKRHPTHGQTRQPCAVTVGSRALGPMKMGWALMCRQRLACQPCARAPAAIPASAHSRSRLPAPRPAMAGWGTRHTAPQPMPNSAAPTAVSAVPRTGVWVKWLIQHRVAHQPWGQCVGQQRDHHRTTHDQHQSPVLKPQETQHHLRVDHGRNRQAKPNRAPASNVARCLAMALVQLAACGGWLHRCECVHACPPAATHANRFAVDEGRGHEGQHRKQRRQLHGPQAAYAEADVQPLPSRAP